jgi:hypothetical protein
MKIGPIQMFFFFVLASLLFLSCMGIATDVKINNNGSGTVTAEYRLSQELVAFGQLDANKDMLPVPLSEADVRKGLRAAKGLSFVSWSSKQDGTDLLVKTVIAFDSLSALALYLDPQGKLAQHETSLGTQRLAFSLGDTLPSIDPEMKQIAREAFAPYNFSFSFELPSPATDVRSNHPAIKSSRNGTNVRFEAQMQDLISSETVPSIMLSW